MTNLYEMYATDTKAEVDGIWYPVNDEVKFKLARAGGANAAFTKVMEEKTRPYRRQIQQDTMDAKLADKLYREVFAETVVLDWAGVKDKSGKNVKYSADTAKKLLDELPELFNELRDVANKAATFRNQDILDDAGN